MRIHWLQHVPFEDLGSIESWALSAGHSLSKTRFFAQDSLPAPGSFDMLVVMGGPMGVHDSGRFPWLGKEKLFIKNAINDGNPVLGICLGAQLIANVLGARVYAGRFKEIGWFEVQLTEEAWNFRTLDFLPHRFRVFQWHGDTFDLPAGAQGVAWSEGCRNQAFVYRKRVVGLQFHLESTPDGVKRLVEYCGWEIQGNAPYQQKSIDILGARVDYRRMNALMSSTMDYLVSSVMTTREIENRQSLPVGF